MGGRGASSGLSATSLRIKFETNFKRQETNESVKKQIIGLAREYENYLTSVHSGAGGSKGFVEVDGTMRLSSTDAATVYHEFAHSIASTTRDSLGMSDNKSFWAEIRKIRTQYREAVAKDSSNAISGYADSRTNGKHGLDEFFAEGFALGKMRSSGEKISRSSGLSSSPKAAEWADKIVKTTNKYFRKKKK